MKTFGELKVGDTFYEHIGGTVLTHEILNLETFDGRSLCLITYKDCIGDNSKHVLSDSTCFFPFYTSIDEIRKMTEVLTYYLEKKEGVSC